MSERYNFFINKGESVAFDMRFKEDGVVVEDLTGHVFRFNTIGQSVLGVIAGSIVSWIVPVGETTKFTIDHTMPDGHYDVALFGDVNVKDWLGEQS